MAAPHVAGALAVLKAAFPGLSPEALVERLLQTAINPFTLQRGDYDETGTFGFGLMDLEAAMQPSGALSVPMSDGSVPASATTLAVGPGLSPDELQAALTDVVMFDEAGFPFIGSIAANVEAQRNTNAALDSFLDFRPLTRRSASVTDGLNLSFIDATEEQHWRRRLAFSVEGRQPFAQDRYRLRFAMGENGSVEIGRDTVGGSIIDRAVGGSAVAGFTDGYVSDAVSRLAGVSDHAQAHLRLSETTAIRAGGHVGANPGARNDTRGFFAGLDQRVGDDVTVAAKVSYLNEDGGFLGSTSKGALGGIDRAQSTYLTLSGHWAVLDQVVAFGSVNLGWTDADGGSGIMRDAGTMRGEAYTAGMAVRDVVRENDRFMLVGSLPYRVGSADVDVSVPSAVTATGRIIHDNRTISLAPAGREKRVGASYGIDFPRSGTEMSFGGLVRLEPDHDASADHEFVAGTRIGLKF
jgi:hypothetical protein